METDPDEWCDELKAQLLALELDSTVEEIAETLHPMECSRVLEAVSTRYLYRF